jgi:hypothetical protein
MIRPIREIMIVAAAATSSCAAAVLLGTVCVSIFCVSKSLVLDKSRIPIVHYLMILALVLVQGV